MNTGPLTNEHLSNIYREIIAASRALQKQERIACLGPEGTFSCLAAQEFFGNTPELCLYPSLQDVFSVAAAGECDFAVVPVENSLNGTVGMSIDAFARHNVTIIAEWYSRIQHSLLSSESSLENIHTVYSHSQPLGQCSTWLRAHLPNAQLVTVDSTAAAARKIGNEPNAAAIAHKSHAMRHQLTLLACGIEDNPDNWTRFFAITAPENAADISDADKTSILFTLQDRPGSLSKVLTCFADNAINLTKLESRPMPGEAWKYMFSADLGGATSSPQLQDALDKARDLCASLRVLGSYVQGKRLRPRE